MGQCQSGEQPPSPPPPCAGQRMGRFPAPVSKQRPLVLY